MRFRELAAGVLATAVVAFWAGRLTAPAGPASQAAPGTLAGVPQSDVFTVTHTVDGDTVHVVQEGMEGKEKVRLLAINTPERGQPWHDEATGALALLVQGKTVRLEPEKPGKLQRDKYGRWLAYLIVDGKNVNVEMIRLGWTPYVTQYRSDRYEKEMRAAEEEARRAKRGMWVGR